MIALPPSPGACEQWPYYRGFAPLGACHWQCLANLAARAGGIPGLPAIFGASLGITWAGGSTLLGGNRWCVNLAAIWNLHVAEHTAPSRPEAQAMEESWWRDGLPYVAEVDPVFLPWWGKSEHVVHSVIVMGGSGDGVKIVDPMEHPRVAVLAIGTYWELRGAPAVGRTGPYKSYLPWPDAVRPAAPELVMRRLRADVAEHGGKEASQLAGFMAWAENNDSVIDVCRVAAERHQATLLFEHLRDGGLADATSCLATARAARDTWYLVHLMSAAGGASDVRRRQRVVRLLRGAEALEQEMREAISA